MSTVAIDILHAGNSEVSFLVEMQFPGLKPCLHTRHFNSGKIFCSEEKTYHKTKSY